jgi:hypothetical protein
MSTLLAVLGSLSVLVGMAALVLALRILRSALSSERMGNERLEILREQQQRLGVLREEREMILEELRRAHDRHTELEGVWRESLVEQENGRVRLPAVRGELEGAARRWWWFGHLAARGGFVSSADSAAHFGKLLAKRGSRNPYTQRERVGKEPGIRSARGSPSNEEGQRSRWLVRRKLLR